MIKYTLKCSNDHVFDGWFSNSLDFDAQRDAKLVACPICGVTAVEKTLMAPSVTGTKKQNRGLLVEDGPIIEHDSGDADAEQPMDGDMLPTQIPEPLVHGDQTMRAVVEKMRELRSWVEKNADNVGDQFANKARKMHFGEEEHRGIFGKATFEEAQELIDDGIDFLPLPGLPEDNN